MVTDENDLKHYGSQVLYRNGPTFLDRQVWANSVETDHTLTRV